MKHLFVFIALLLALTTNAQKIRFTDSTNKWSTYVANTGVPVQYDYHYLADTVIGGTTYKQLQGHFERIACTFYSCVNDMGGVITNFVREDTALRRVYYYNTTTHTDDLLYNYNMHVGDAITFGTYIDTVATLDSTIINGVYHKIFNMRGANSGRTYTVLEGVGCTNRPGFPINMNICFEFGESLVCFYHNGLKPAARAPISGCGLFSWCCGSPTGFTEFDNTLNCGITLSVANNQPDSKPTISPNPATNYFNINLHGKPGNNYWITAYDLTGRCILRTQVDIQNVYNLNTTSWNPGLYQIIIQDNSGILLKEKIVIER